MYIILIGEHSPGMSKDEILSCSALIIHTKEQLEQLLKSEKLTRNPVRVFEATRELSINPKVSIELVSLEENKVVMQYSPEKGLIDNESGQKE